MTKRNASNVLFNISYSKRKSTELTGTPKYYLAHLPTLKQHQLHINHSQHVYLGSSGISVSSSL